MHGVTGKPPRAAQDNGALATSRMMLLLLVAMTGFEILVSFLQAFIFTILTAVYIGSSMHPDH